MRSIILVVLALLILGGAGFLFLADDSDTLAGGVSGPSEIPIAPVRAPAELEPVPERPVDPAPDKAAARSKQKAQRDGTDPKASKSAPSAPAPETAFQQKYADQTVQELNRTARQLFSEHRSSIQRLMEDRYANAFYDSYPYEYDADGERMDPSDVIPAPAAGEYRIRQIFEDPNVSEWRLVELPESEYPDLYAAYREWSWVSEEVNQREQAKQD